MLLVPKRNERLVQTFFKTDAKTGGIWKVRRMVRNQLTTRSMAGIILNSYFISKLGGCYIEEQNIILLIRVLFVYWDENPWNWELFTF